VSSWRRFQQTQRVFVCGQRQPAAIRRELQRHTSAEFFRERFAQRGQFMDSSTGKTELSHDDAGFNTR
jgi:hypothetical protein